MILCDIDGTIAATGEFLQSRYGIPLAEYPAPFPKEFWTSQEGYEAFRDAAPIPGAVEALKMLDQSNPVHYITVRSPEMKFVTFRWLQLHDFPQGAVFFCDNLKEKGDVARDAALVFDDDPKAPLFYLFRQLIMIARPYNQGEGTLEQVLREGGSKRTRKRF